MSTIPLCTHRYIGLRNSCWAEISVFLMVIHDCTRSVQRSLPFSDSLALGVLGSKRTRETQRVFQPRVDLLPPPKPGLTYRYRVEIIMADGAEAGPNSVLQSREDKTIVDSACEDILRQDSVLDESLLWQMPSIQYTFQLQVLRTPNLLCDQSVMYTCKDAIRRYTIHMHDLSTVSTICVYNHECQLYLYTTYECTSWLNRPKTSIPRSRSILLSHA